MIDTPYWTNHQILFLEYCFDEIFRSNLVHLNIDYLVKQGNSRMKVEALFKNDDELITELVKYWAWKDTWSINPVLITIKNPYRRLFTLLKFSFKNNRYLKLYLQILRMKLTEEAKQEIEEVNKAKHNFLSKLFTDRGLPKEQADLRTKAIVPFYNGWAKDKDNQIKSDVQKFELLSIFKTMLFPELFNNEKISTKELK